MKGGRSGCCFFTHTDIHCVFLLFFLLFASSFEVVMHLQEESPVGETGRSSQDQEKMLQMHEERKFKERGQSKKYLKKHKNLTEEQQQPGNRMRWEKEMWSLRDNRQEYQEDDEDSSSKARDLSLSPDLKILKMIMLSFPVASSSSCLSLSFCPFDRNWPWEKRETCKGYTWWLFPMRRSVSSWCFLTFGLCPDLTWRYSRSSHVHVFLWKTYITIVYTQEYYVIVKTGVFSQNEKCCKQTA